MLREEPPELQHNQGRDPLSCCRLDGPDSLSVQRIGSWTDHAAETIVQTEVQTYRLEGRYEIVKQQTAL